ncbi:MAG: cysteine desulfurase [Candidatus Bathyarchaeota archaeon]|nr:MAG: cysteine desulfurase [Candidatus Bathyarchaeota archaeon]
MTKRKIFVDYASTTPVDPQVIKAMKPYFAKLYGNASSLNDYGVAAKRALEKAREGIAKFMKAEANELVFTGSATEANNLVLKGHALKERKAKCHIAISAIEHSSILESAKWLEDQGYKITYLPVDEYGLLRLNALEEALKENATLVSVVHGNNEIGTIQQIEKIAGLCHEYDTLFHTDAVQSFGKIPISVEKVSIDFMTINAHKLYGPKGIGALYIDNPDSIKPLIHGGGHEFGLRSGTENVPGIVGFAKAVELRMEEMLPEAKRLVQLRDKLIKGILEIKDVHLNGHPTRRLPNNANFRFSYIEGEAIVLALDEEGICASSGSACSSTAGEASHVLLALKLRPEEARGSLRLSLGKYNTERDVNYIIQVMPRVVKRLRAMSILKPSRTKANCIS